MTLMYGQLSPTQIANYLAAIDKFVPNPIQRLNPNGTVQTTETGANLLDKAWPVLMRGVLGKSPSKLVQGRDAVGGALPYVTSGDGFYLDGSFIQHGAVPYLGGYGGAVLSDVGKLTYLLAGSSWAFTDPNISNVYAWARDAYIPAIYDGAMLDSLLGRGASRQFTTGHNVGRGNAVGLNFLAQGAPAADALAIRRAVKGWMQRDTTFGSSYYAPVATAVPGVYAGIGLYDLALLKALAADNAVSAAAEPVKTHVFASQDRVVQREAGFAYDIAMFSKRISSFEYGNGENIKGWWTGMGTGWLYDADQTQYMNGYWATVDMSRLPGTTTDRSGSGTPVPWKDYENVNDYAGGAELDGRYAAVGLDFAASGVTGSSLQAKKSWFLFGDKIVQAGSGIRSTDGVNVETIIENRKLNASGNNLLTVNGVAKPTTLGWSEAMPSVQWAHLAGSVPGADIGYWFPYAPTVYGLRETRSGIWSQINAGNTADTVSNHFLSLASYQGVSPATGAYSQVILPGRSAAQTAAFAANPTVEILERSSAATAARETALGLVGANFWQNAAKTVNVGGTAYLSSDRKASVLTRESGNDLAVSVADPTQTQTGAINIEINRAAVAAVAADAGVTVQQLSPTIKLAVDVAGSAGKSYVARFKYGSTASLGAVADAYVRDGTYANTNYGQTATLTIKNDGVGYARRAFLKFDLGAIAGTIVSARLVLAPSSVGQTTAMTHNAYLASSDSWGETTLSWNNAPAVGSLLGSWSVPAVGSTAQIDVTNQAAAALAGDKLLSIRVEAAANYGANGWVEYAARENGVTTAQPKLVVTYY
ncbi:polysaccharide lyase 8 family protein [Chitinimonas koreensis]|nr:polysaccharide lyase 8 family protein [Chitinimonas koreensis]